MHAYLWERESLSLSRTPTSRGGCAESRAARAFRSSSRARWAIPEGSLGDTPQEILKGDIPEGAPEERPEGSIPEGARDKIPEGSP